jgi:hypothetical protein
MESIAMQKIEVHAYGSLRQMVKDGTCHVQEPQQDSKIRVLDLLCKLGIPRENVQLVMRNHRAVTMSDLVSPGDRLAFFPREYPLFVDWKDFR